MRNAHRPSSKPLRMLILSALLTAPLACGPHGMMNVASRYDVEPVAPESKLTPHGGPVYVTKERIPEEDYTLLAKLDVTKVW